MIRRSLPGTVNSTLPIGRRRPQPFAIKRTVTKPKPKPKPKYAKEIHIEQYTCTDLQNVTAPPVDVNVPWLAWPAFLQPMFVISLRPKRYVSFLDRMKRWRTHVQLIPATDGRKINRDQWASVNRLNTDQLTNGQIGCYESHVRVWRRIVDQNLPYALVFEDDVDIRYTQETVDKLNEVVAELKTVPNWDIVYIGNDAAKPGGNGQLRFPPKRQHTPHLADVSDWEVLHMYLITKRAAQCFLQDAFPIRAAVDVYMGSVLYKHNIVALGMVPSLAWTVPNESDTNRTI